MILDTNALSAFVDGDGGLAQALSRASHLAIPVQHRLPVVSRDEHFDALPGLERRSW